MRYSIDLRTLESPPGAFARSKSRALLFFGREDATLEELLRRLSESRFLAVVGSSGCGKSSLVRAGLPRRSSGAIYERDVALAVSPSCGPVRRRSTLWRPALTQEGVLGSQDVTKLRETLAATSGGLVEAVRQAGFAPGESLLVVVDQFEEIFRFAPTASPAKVRHRSS